jgi:excisionase family DNA binding protein
MNNEQTDLINEIKLIVDPLSDLITIDQAAEKLNMSKYTIYGYTQRKTIPFHKRGKKLFFSKTDLAAWIKDTTK